MNGSKFESDKCGGVEASPPQAAENALASAVQICHEDRARLKSDAIIWIPKNPHGKKSFQLVSLSLITSPKDLSELLL
jgi:hypothetical protein